MHTQQKRRATRTTSAQSARAQRPEYTAAVRYPDGKRELFYVLNANDMDDARRLVIDELGKVQSLVIALRR